MQKDGYFLNGILMWLGMLIGIPLLILFLLVSFVSGPSRKQAEASKVQAEADMVQAAANRADAEAAVVEAEGQAQVSIIQAEAQADVLRMYTEVGVEAIETDRKSAHKEMWLVELLIGTLKPLYVTLLICLILIVCVMLAMVWRKWGDLLVFWANQRMRRAPDSNVDVLEPDVESKSSDPSENDDVILGPSLPSDSNENGVYKDVTFGEDEDA